MKAIMRRSFRSAALVAAALLVGVAAVPLFAGADALDAARSSLLGESSSCPSAKAATASAENTGVHCLFSLLKDADLSAKLTAGLEENAGQACSEGGAKANAGLQAKLGDVAEPSTCSAGAKAAKADAVAKTEAEDAKIAKVAGDVPASCADKVGDAKAVAKVESTEPAACSAGAKAANATKAATCSTGAADAKIAKVTETAPSQCSTEKTGAVAKTENVDAKAAKAAAEVPACCAEKEAEAEVAAKLTEAKAAETAEIPACCQDKAEKAGD